MTLAHKTVVKCQQATIFAALEGLTPEEMIAPMSDHLNELATKHGADVDLLRAEAFLAGFVQHLNRFLANHEA